jgi:Sulfotransferase domain
VLKSHESFQPHYCRIIYIVRDPRDVVVSFYHHNLKAGNIPDNYPMDEFVPRFINAEFDTKFGSWSDNVLSWLSLRGSSDKFLLLRYEEMKQDPAKELSRVATFLECCAFPQIDRSPEKLARAVELSSPERMRKLESLQARQWELTKHTRHDKPFVRTATAGKWKSVLSQPSVTLIEAAWGNLMQRLGYELSSGTLDTTMRGKFPEETVSDTSGFPSRATL